MFFVYIIKNSVNSKWYVGQTKNPTRRWIQHKHSARGSGQHFIHKAMRKHGSDNFWMEVILEYETGAETDAAEAELIDFFSLTDDRYGYNLLPGGNGSEHASAAARYGHTLRSIEIQATHEDIARIKSMNHNAGLKRWASKDKSARSAVARKSNAAQTPLQRSERLRRANAVRTPEEKAEAHRKRLATLGIEGRRKMGAKIWETRRKNIAAGLEEHPADRMRRVGADWARKNPEKKRAQALYASECARQKAIARRNKHQIGVAI